MSTVIIQLVARISQAGLLSQHSTWLRPEIPPSWYSFALTQFMFTDGFVTVKLHNIQLSVFSGLLALVGCCGCSIRGSPSWESKQETPCLNVVKIIVLTPFSWISFRQILVEFDLCRVVALLFSRLAWWGRRPRNDRSAFSFLELCSDRCNTGLWRGKPVWRSTVRCLKFDILWQTIEQVKEPEVPHPWISPLHFLSLIHLMCFVPFSVLLWLVSFLHLDQLSVILKNRQIGSWKSESRHFTSPLKLFWAHRCLL